MDDREKMFDDLCATLLKPQTKEACALLLKDLCTDKELEQLAQRMRAAQLIMSGRTYMQVMAETDISSATLSRVSRCVQYGKGYVQFVEKEQND